MTLNNDDLLVSAAGVGRLSDVRELLEKGANIEARDSDGYTSLHRAAEGGHLEIIRFLIDKGANIGAKNKDGKNPLDVANDLGKTEVVNFLGPKQSEYDRLLFAAVESGNVSEVTNLLNIGANIEARGAKNETPLCAASRINKLDVLELLLSRNANVNVQDDDRRTPLHHAAYLGKGVELILDKGANIEAKDINDWTPLHYAAWGGQSDTVKTLVNKWANIGAKNKDGGKPLDVANTSRQSEVVNFLGPKQSEYDRLLFAAVESGNVSEVTNLLNIGASIEVKGVENAEFRLARYVKRIMEMSNYHNVHSEKKSELERIKGELPESVKNAVFSSEVCIKSVYYSNEYLYPASDYLSHDRDRRRVFTWRPGGKDSSCQWKFEPEGNNIYIKSTYFNEYLYPAGNGLSHDRDRRRVFTWRPGGKDSSCQWKFEPEGNNIYIKSTYFNEYLYPASDYLSHDRDRRRVFTWRPGAKIVHVNGKLRIVDLLARSVMYNIVLQKKLSVIYLMIMHQTIHRKVTK